MVVNWVELIAFALFFLFCSVVFFRVELIWNYGQESGTIGRILLCWCLVFFWLIIHCESVVFVRENAEIDFSSAGASCCGLTLWTAIFEDFDQVLLIPFIFSYSNLWCYGAVLDGWNVKEMFVWAWGYILLKPAYIMHLIVLRINMIPLSVG